MILKKGDVINERVNILRGMAIIGVVIIHTTFYFTEITTLSPLVVILAGIDIYSHFAVPLFIIISGYVLGLKYCDNYSIKTFYKKRINRIIIPYLLWSILYISLNFSTSGNISEILFMLLTGNAYYHLWFFFLIFQLYLIFPFYRKLIKNNNLIFILFLLAIQITFNHFKTDVFESGHIKLVFERLFLSHLFYFSLGIWLSDNTNKAKIFLLSITKNKNLIILSFTLLSSFLFSFNWLASINHFFEINKYYVIAEHIILPLTFLMIIINLYSLSSVINSSKLKNVFLILSKYSFGIYLSHALILRILVKIMEKLYITHDNILFYVSSFVFTFILSILFCYIIESTIFSRYLISLKQKII
jgi:surface polysaccharide O-acyltransferase-like enzyme